VAFHYTGSWELWNYRSNFRPKRKRTNFDKLYFNNENETLSTPGVTLPPGSNMGRTTAMGTTTSDNAGGPQVGLALKTRGVANVRGKKTEPVAPASAAPAAASLGRASFDTTTAAGGGGGTQSSSNHNPYGPSSSSSGLTSKSCKQQQT
jgi:hypothetical protein